MRDPCEGCLVQGNCTKICEPWVEYNAYERKKELLDSFPIDCMDCGMTRFLMSHKKPDCEMCKIKHGWDLLRDNDE